jgi:hypothetical protein
MTRKNNAKKKLGGITGKGFKPGQSGNPNGRPVAGWSWAELIREYGNKDCPAEFSSKLGLSEKPKWKEVVIAMAYRHAAKGNASILKTLVEYIDGRVPLEINFSVAEKLKQEAAENGIDWRENPALVEIIAADEALANRHGNYQGGSEIGRV